MTKDAKNVKLASLACLFAGVFVIAATIYLAVTEGFTPGSGLCLGAGAASLVCGAQCARLVNVPSNAAKIRSLALVLFVLAAAVAGAGYSLGLLSMLQMGLCAGIALFALVTVLVAHTLKRALDRV